MSCYFKINCFTNNEDEMKNIANKHTEYILKIQEELKNYKDFHDAIIHNDVIMKKFSDYEKKINELESEISALKKRET